MGISMAAPMQPQALSGAAMESRREIGGKDAVSVVSGAYDESEASDAGGFEVN